MTQVVGLDLDQGVKRVHEVLEVAVNDFELWSFCILRPQLVKRVQVEQCLVTLDKLAVSFAIVEEVLIIGFACAPCRVCIDDVLGGEAALIDFVWWLTSCRIEWVDTLISKTIDWYVFERLQL